MTAYGGCRRSASRLALPWRCRSVSQAVAMAIPRRLPSYLAAALALTTVAKLAAGEPFAWHCGKTGTFSANSTYQMNLQHLAGVLPNFTASAPTMFARATMGAIPDAVNAEALCRGDDEAPDCRDCVATAFMDAQQTCVYDKAVTLFQDRCSLRFSNENLVDSPDDDDDDSFTAYTSNRSASAPAQAFGAAVALLLEATSEHAATSSSRFATAAQSFEHLGGVANMYALAQCQPVMASQQCHECLSQLLLGMPDFYQDKRDGRLLQWRCFLRFDDHPFFNGKPIVDLPPVPSGETRGDRWRKYKKILVATAVFLTALLIMTLVFLLIKSRRKAARKVELQRNNFNTLWQTESSSGFTLFSFSELAASTGHFSDENRLGSGGFGTVYKGKLRRGAEIAVKRLSSRSRQGSVQFKNEVQLIVKLQHTNLVRLLGCCAHGEEKLLVYEFMPNGSLDCFIFDQQRGSLLDWEKRVRIIEGIAQGLLYLHEHSRVRIIHRDMKTSNILLDGNMNPKISDFGLARIFPSDMSEVNTNRVVGTIGYMAPEYTSGGTFSVKSDVYSFGVLVLEIISGKKNSSQNQYGIFDNLLEYAWQLWRESKMFELIDPTLQGESGQVMVSIERCVKVALLCVQDRATDRPTMADVVAMLVSRDGSMSLPDPRRPQQISPPRVTPTGAAALGIRTPSHGTTTCTINDVTITTIQGR